MEIFSNKCSLSDIIISTPRRVPGNQNVGTIRTLKFFERGGDLLLWGYVIYLRKCNQLWAKWLYILTVGPFFISIHQQSSNGAIFIWRPPKAYTGTNKINLEETTFRSTIIKCVFFYMIDLYKKASWVSKPIFLSKSPSPVFSHSEKNKKERETHFTDV